MSNAQSHLEKRISGYFWRRRVPARVANQFKPPFFCFSLKTQVSCEAAELARRLTAISEFCFNVESDLDQTTMTLILTGYARFEIDAHDRLRALMPPRSRAAAEAALALETASRASLRDAIFLCDRSAAVEPVTSTAAKLGIELDTEDDDYPTLLDKMMRLLLEVSEEKDRRAKGVFSDTQPYLAKALDQKRTSLVGHDDAAAASELDVPSFRSIRTPSETEADLPDPTATDTELCPTLAPASAARPVFGNDNLNVTLVAPAASSGANPVKSDKPVLQLWDLWIDAMSRGVRRSGRYKTENAELGAKFQKDHDTRKSTRKLLSDVFGDKPISDIEHNDWVAFNDVLFGLPKSHGKSKGDSERTCFEIIERAKKKADIEKRKARHTTEPKRKEQPRAKPTLATYPALSPRTVQRHQTNLKAALNYAVEVSEIDRNPYAEYALSEAIIEEMRQARPDSSRKLWHEEFDDLIRTKKWQSDKTAIDDPLFWLPIISRLHGMRSQEILQLKPNNVRLDAGIYYFDIERGTGQSAKSNNARRLIPLHSQLIDLGFLELIAWTKRNKKRRIFSDVEPSSCSKQSLSGPFGKRFYNYRKAQGIYEERRDFHALRTTFNSKMVGLAVPDTARRYLMGHKNGDVGITNYLPEGFPLKTLKEYIELEQIDIALIGKRFAKSQSRPKRPVLIADQGKTLEHQMVG
ncbi:MAG: tyrosine-type recombinase/integrase [Paracoccaceae bacterium]|nr:tyrosine-type recombinase/integrase [Paracoccaceae bacterium]